MALTALMVTLLAAAPALAQSASLQTCRNFSASTPRFVDCTGDGTGSLGWNSGAAGLSHAFYRKGDFVPFRAFVYDLRPRERYTLRIAYDALENGKHAFDYLGTYNATRRPATQVIDPCSSRSNPPYRIVTVAPNECGTDPSRTDVPEDTRTLFPSGPSQQIPGHFSAWGATLHSAAYVVPSSSGGGTNATALPPLIQVGTPGRVIRYIDLQFTPHGTGVVIAWSAHIASSPPWPPDTTEVGGSNHVAIVDSRGAGVANGGLGFNPGGQDRKVEVVKPPSLYTSLAVVQPCPGPARPSGQVNEGCSVIDTAHLSGHVWPRGHVSFFVCSSETPLAAPGCPLGGPAERELPPPIVAARVGATSTSEARKVFTPDEGPGFYCFRAEYDPADNANFDPATHTNPLIGQSRAECFQVVAVEQPPPPEQPMLTIEKLCEPNNGGQFTVTIDGASTGAHTLTCGGTTGALPVNAGEHTVAETGAGGTDLGGFEQTIACNGHVGGDFHIAESEHVTCVISNVRRSEEPDVGELTVLKLCAPATDSGRFNLQVDGATAADVPCGGSLGPLVRRAGTYHVRETAGTATDLSAYTRVFGGDCRADGSIRLAARQVATCTITNIRHGTPTAVLTVQKHCRPGSQTGLFELAVDEQSFRGVGCGESTGRITMSIGTHVVAEVASPLTIPNRWATTYGGDCDAGGRITLRANQHVTCTVTNSRIGRVLAAERTRRPRPRPPHVTG